MCIINPIRDIICIETSEVAQELEQKGIPWVGSVGDKALHPKGVRNLDHLH